MKNKIEIKSIWGKVLFKFKKEDNSTEETLLEAFKKGADLQGADLRDAKIDDIKRYISNFWIIPEQGSFEAWKKLANNSLAKLLIPANAKRTCNLMNRKCRAEYVKVLAIWNAEGKKVNEGISKGEGDAVTIKYTVGKITKSDSFDDSVLIDCSHGIHFFVTKQEAIDY